VLALYLLCGEVLRYARTMASGPDSASFRHWAEIAGKIQQGDNAGVEDLYNALSAGYCANLLRHADPQSVEDGLHEILLTVVEAIRAGELRDPFRLMGFVRTLTRRRAFAHIRKAVFERKYFVPSGHAEPLTPEESPEARTARLEGIERILQVLRRLNTRDREILERFYLAEQTPPQICSEMHLTSTQFRLYKSRAIGRCFDLARPRRRLGSTVD